MKLIIKRIEKKKGYIKTDNNIRRTFIKQKRFQSWALYEELLSHKNGFNCSTIYIRDKIGFSQKMWDKYARELEDMGYLQRFKRKGCNEWTFTLNEIAIESTSEAKEKKKKFRDSVKAKKEKTNKEKASPKEPAYFVPNIPPANMIY